MTALFRITMMFVGYVWACIAASLVLALGTLTPEWDYFFRSLGVQSSQAQSTAMWVIVGLGALIIFVVGFLPSLLAIVITEGFRAPLGPRLWRDRRRVGAGHGVWAGFRRL